MHFSPSGFGYCPFHGGGSNVVGLLLLAVPIVRGGLCLVLVLLCSSLCPLKCFDSLAGVDRSCCFGCFFSVSLCLLAFFDSPFASWSAVFDCGIS